MPIVLIRKLRLSWWQSWNWHKRSLDINHSALVARLIKLLTWGNENLWTNILLRDVVFINDNYWYWPSQSFCCHQDPEEVELITRVELFFSIKLCCCYCSVMSNSLQPHGLQHARLLCPPLSPGVCSNSCPLSQWCYPNISPSAALFSFCLHSFPASESFPMSQLFISGGQSIEASASAPVLLKNIQSWSFFPMNSPILGG